MDQTMIMNSQEKGQQMNLKECLRENIEKYITFWAPIRKEIKVYDKEQIGG